MAIILLEFLLAKSHEYYLKYHFQLQELVTQLNDLWDLMDTPTEERSLFDHVTCNRTATVDEVTAPGALALDMINQVR
jgi:hypothetical protein